MLSVAMIQRIIHLCNTVGRQHSTKYSVQGHGVADMVLCLEATPGDIMGYREAQHPGATDTARATDTLGVYHPTALHNTVYMLYMPSLAMV